MSDYLLDALGQPIDMSEPVRCIEHSGRSRRGSYCGHCGGFVCDSCWRDLGRHRGCGEKQRQRAIANIQLQAVIDVMLDSRAAAKLEARMAREVST